jgi:hypothetical protein
MHILSSKCNFINTKMELIWLPWQELTSQHSFVFSWKDIFLVISWCKVKLHILREGPFSVNISLPLSSTSAQDVYRHNQFKFLPHQQLDFQFVMKARRLPTPKWGKHMSNKDPNQYILRVCLVDASPILAGWIRIIWERTMSSCLLRDVACMSGCKNTPSS